MNIEHPQTAAKDHRLPFIKADGRWISLGLGAAFVVVLGMPLLVTVLWSLVDPQVGWFAPDILPTSRALNHWSGALRNPSIVSALGLSIGIGIAVTILTATLALPTAYALAKLPFRMKRFVEVFVLAPLIVPGIIVAVGIGAIFFRLDLVYTVSGVILVQTVGTLPLMIRILAATIEAIPNDLIAAARTLGAGPGAIARYILIPLAWPGFIAGGLLTFVSSFEEFEKTFIIGSPFVQTLPVILWTYLGGRGIIFPNAAVVTFILLVPMLIVFFLAGRVLRDDVLASGMGKL
ncbi:ABC transporter permease subunit [Rhodobacteraceae bacterium N5(2021)]|uniref:ABC transporter permease subunit n=1 Tax=Gymnodinialimonas phycosphaerae TaxID=2841589 RepID=A0A975TR69_9RHOB|nr:ABC transporter permease subunit [Gymnodinialimonas phycosphaerae]MBY4893519.1 ABC transporter permease subunit [Gymnodinialimonas phycosphaerae]